MNLVALKTALDAGKLLALIPAVVELIQVLLDEEPEKTDEELVTELDEAFALTGLAELLDGPVIRISILLARWARARKARRAARATR